MTPTDPRECKYCEEGINGSKRCRIYNWCSVAFAINSPLKPRKMENNQTPSECKHYNNGACVAHNSTKCLNTLFSVRYGYQKPNCLDYEPKEKKDNDSRTTENN